jgi:hypothetical protein
MKFYVFKRENPAMLGGIGGAQNYQQLAGSR